MTRDTIKPIARALVLPVAIALIAPPQAVAQKRSRGSVSSATREGNTNSWQGRRASGTGRGPARVTDGRTAVRGGPGGPG